MLRCLKVVIICFICLIFLPAIARLEEIYKIERMWPVLSQPWYFYSPCGMAIDNDGFVYVADSQNDQIQKFTEDGQFITKWGKKGKDHGEFDQPRGVTVDRDGFLYVVDSENYRIQKFKSDGQFVKEWGSRGKEDGEFNSPYGIAVSISDDVYVVDTINNNVQKFTTDGEFIAKWGKEGHGNGEFDWPRGIAVDSDGFVYVADTDNQRIQKFGISNGFVYVESKSSVNGKFRPFGIATDRKGFVYVTDMDKDKHCIRKFTKDLQFEDSWGNIGNGDGEFDKPDGIAVNNNGFIYVADSKNSRVQKFDAKDGRFITKWGAGELKKPDGIAVNSDNYIYVADTDNHRIQIFDRDFEYIDSWGKKGSGDGEFDMPNRIAVRNGFVYVADTNNHRIQKFTEDGVFIDEWGCMGTSDGEFRFPYGIAVDKYDYIYVADRGNNRIQKLDPDGGFVAKREGGGKGDGEFDNPHGIAVNASGNIYVADTGNNRIQIFNQHFEFVDKFGDKGNGEGEFDIPYDITLDSDGFIHVVDSCNHRIQKFTPDGEFISAWGEEGSNPGQLKYPGAGAVSPDGNYYIADNHNHRIQVFKKVPFASNNKAIIVAGGGPYPGNHLWNATRMNANFAYRALNHQGFTKDNIYYLTSDKNLDLDNNGKPDDVDGDAANINLQNAITTWAKDADNLVVYLVDHGGEEKFRMSETEILSVTKSNSWLNQIQETIQGKLIVIYDACMSGSFLNALNPASGTKRIIITSTSPDENAHFISQGSLSFSNFFWTNIFDGNNIGQAFDTAKHAISNVTNFQHPHMIGDRNTYIGNGTANHWEPPEIIYPAIDSKTLYADVTDKDGIARVWAVIIPPYYNQRSSKNPVLELPSFELMPVQYDRYKGAYNNINDIDSIAIYARDRIGNSSNPTIIQVSTNSLQRRRAIIGASDSQSDILAEMAYKALTFQGYTENDIYFISPITSFDGVDDINTLSNLSYAINNWASENTHDLVVYLVGNGKDSAFQINDTETLSINDLDNWLDKLQNKIPGKVTIICDIDYSGSFLPLLTPPPDKKRIVISGTSNGHEALFLSQGTISFSNFFWKGVLNGMTIRDAFSTAGNAIGFFSETHSYNNKPQMDDNGNGIGNESSDGQLAMYYTIGMGIRLAENDPLVGSSSPDHTLTGGETSADIWADVTTTSGKIAKVWAVVTPPDYSSNLNLPEFELSDAGDGRYKGTYHDFSIFGTYQVAVYAMDTDGKVSLSKKTLVFQPAGPDTYETDNNPGQARVIIINDETPHHHNLYDPGDEDWIKFYGLSGESYEITTDNMGTNFNANIEIYNSDIEIQASFETPVYPWKCDKEGVYYVKVSHANPEVSGEGTEYDIMINQPTGPLSGWIRGKITEEGSGEPVQGALISVGSASAISLLDGSYSIIHKPGTFTMKICGHEFGNVCISEGGTTIMNLELTKDKIENCPIPDPLVLSPPHMDDVKPLGCFISASDRTPLWKLISRIIIMNYGNNSPIK